MDPDDRPPMSQIVAVLLKAQNVKLVPCRPRMRNADEMRAKWVDVKYQYQKLTYVQLEKLATSKDGKKEKASFSYEQWKDKLASVWHTTAQSDLLSVNVLCHFMPNREYDIFLIHTGKQKPENLLLGHSTVDRCPPSKTRLDHASRTSVAVFTYHKDSG